MHRIFFSFVVGFAFSEMLDVHEMWINVLPTAIGYRVLYFIISYLLLCIGIALSNRCGLPIIPTDLFPRELADITKSTIFQNQDQLRCYLPCSDCTDDLYYPRTSGRTWDWYNPGCFFHGKSDWNDR